MSPQIYKEPPLVKTYLGHATVTGVLGMLLPSGEHLGWLHERVLPVVELIPNAVRMTNRAPDPVFSQTFIGLSLVVAFAILVFYVVAMRGYHTRTFDRTITRILALAYVWGIVLILLAIFWWMPYLDPLSKGRAYFITRAAISSNLGVITAMNQLVVGMPLLCCLGLWGGHACTNVRHRTGFI